MASLELSFLLLSILAGVLLSFIVYFRKSYSATHSLFGFVALITIILLVLAYIAEHLVTDPVIARLKLLFHGLQVIGLYVFAHTIPRSEPLLTKKQLHLLFAALLGILFLSVSPYAFVGLEQVDGVLAIKTGPALPLFGIFIILMNILIFHTLIVRMRECLRRSTYKQFLWAGIGIVASAGLPLFTITLPIILFQNTSFIPFGPLYQIAFFIITSVAILKYQE